MMRCLTMFILGLAMVLGTISPGMAEPGASQGDRGQVVSPSSGQILRSILELKKSLSHRISEKKKVMEASTSESEKAFLAEEIAKLDVQLSDAGTDFERVATGVDISLFAKGKRPPFDWKQEVLSLAQPGILELKRVTLKARKKAQMKDDLAEYQQLQPVAQTALKNLQRLVKEAKDPAVKQHLESLLPEWKGVTGQINNKIHFLRLELDKMIAEETSLIDSSQASMKRFFKTRGLFIFIALVACTAIVLVLRFFYRGMVRWVPGYRQPYRPFHLRVFELVFRILTVLLTLGAMVLVFYLFEDWVLLSLTVILIFGLGWTAKNTLPRFVQESRMMLNIGSVREGERIWYKGVPWRVNRINMFSELENPALDITLRVPIEELMALSSRGYEAEEVFFPCRKNDWVILEDGTRGCVVSLSHEMVVMVLRGGARKTYLTPDFLGLSPLNLSADFRLKVSFGIGYGHQGQAVGPVLDILRAHLEQRLADDAYEESLLNLRVEFEQANASSLDLVVIADFKGDMAPIYNRLKRAIQRWCVEACTQNDWEIPYPQMVVHPPAPAS